MAETQEAQKVFVTGGAESAGLATVRALLRAGHLVAASACDAESALTIRMAGALPVYPDLGRASELLSTLQMTKTDVVVHAGPQFYGGSPHGSAEYAAYADQLVAFTQALVEASKAQGVQRLVSISFAYLYESGHGAAKEGGRDVHDAAYAPLLKAEALIRESGLNAAIIRSGYIYGGHSAETYALAESIKRSQRLSGGARPASWIHEDDLASAILALIEADASGEFDIINVADDTPITPDEFATALSDALGLNAPAFASNGLLSMLRGRTMRDELLAREVLIDSRLMRERFGWSPAYPSAAAGMEATTMVWRIKEAVNPDDYYNAYADDAAEAIESFAYDVALPEPEAVAEAPAPQPEAVAEQPTPAQAAAPPPSDGPAPWNEDEAKREERRRKALERKAKRAARGGGS